MFAFIMASVMEDRWKRVFILYDTLDQKEQTILDPVALAKKKMNLFAKKKQLASEVTKGEGQYEQSETGVFEYLNANAKAASIRFESLAPIEPQTNEEVKEIGFKLRFASDYHRIGAFLNSIESGEMLSEIKRIDITSKAATSSVLQVNVEGVTRVFYAKF